MRIAIFTENYHRGGVDTFIITLLNHWPDPETHFTLVCNEDHPGIEDIRSRLRRPCPVVTHSIATYSGLVLKTRGKSLLDLLRKASTPIIKYIYIVSAICNLRTTLCNGQYDRLLVVNGGYPGGDTCRAAGIAWGLFSDSPLSVHNFHGLSVRPRKMLWIQEYVVDMVLAKFTQVFVTVSRSAALSLSLRPALDMKKVCYIYNGIEQPANKEIAVNIKSQLNIPECSKICLMLGAYETYKGHLFLLRAFRTIADAIPEAHLVVCGYGTEQQIADVQRMTEKMGLHDNVHLMGFRTDAMSILGQSDVLVVASQEFESFGLTCVEAMARRVPVVTTCVGGLPEVVANNEGGYCIDKMDASSYASAVIRLLNDQRLRHDQGELGYERYCRMFRSSRMARDYAALLTDS